MLLEGSGLFYRCSERAFVLHTLVYHVDVTEPTLHIATSTEILDMYLH